MANPEEHIFNSYIDPVPGIRPGLHVFTEELEGEPVIGFYDELGYSTEHFALPGSAEQILSLINGEYSIQQIMMYCGDEITAQDILNYVQFLDRNRLLDSAFFKAHSKKIDDEYASSKVHKSVTAGTSFSENSTELKKYMDTMFEGFKPEKEVSKEGKALFAPHIDTRVGISSYVKAFSAIRHLKPKRVVIIGTSHYSGLFQSLYEYKPFILVNKDFEMPNGTIKADSSTIDKLMDQARSRGIESITADDRAHRIEHSIELHALFLNYIWDHDYEIIPILVGNFQELLYMSNSSLGKEIDAAVNLMNEVIPDEETFYLISGDLSHIGKKFGDEQPAEDMIEAVNKFDQKFLDTAAHSGEEALLSHMKTNFDAYRICGFPPLMTFLKSKPNLKGEIISYDVWDEKEKESAVSFGSILYS